MKVSRCVGFALVLALTFGAGMIFQTFGLPAMKKTTYLELQEPLLLEVLEPGAQQQDFHMLPAGSALYPDYTFPEGHTRYIVYINIKAQIAAREIVSDKPNFIAPLWAEPVATRDLPALMANTPVSKKDLVRILKARAVTREDLAQIVREWSE